MPAGDGYIDVVRTTPASNHAGQVVRQVGEVSAVAAAESVANPTAFQRLSHDMLWNQSTWDRAMGNVEGTAFANAIRTGATAESSDITNYNHRGAAFVLNYSTGGTSNLIMMRVQGKDEAVSDTYYNIFSTVTLSATGTAAYTVYPGISAGAQAALVSGGSANHVLPRTFRVQVIQSGTSLTANFGVGYSMIV